MHKVRSVLIFAANIALMVLSGVFYKFPQGDEYLVLFMISLLFMAAPYVMDVRATGILLGANLLFLVL